jgi:hypothetical protein
VMSSHTPAKHPDPPTTSIYEITTETHFDGGTAHANLSTINRVFSGRQES